MAISCDKHYSMFQLVVDVVSHSNRLSFSRVISISFVQRRKLHFSGWIAIAIEFYLFFSLFFFLIFFFFCLFAASMAWYERLCDDKSVLDLMATHNFICSHPVCRIVWILNYILSHDCENMISHFQTLTECYIEWWAFSSRRKWITRTINYIIITSGDEYMAIICLMYRICGASS